MIPHTVEIEIALSRDKMIECSTFPLAKWVGDLSKKTFASSPWTSLHAFNRWA